MKSFRTAAVVVTLPAVLTLVGSGFVISGQERSDETPAIASLLVNMRTWKAAPSSALRFAPNADGISVWGTAELDPWTSTITVSLESSVEGADGLPVGDQLTLTMDQIGFRPTCIAARDGSRIFIAGVHSDGTAVAEAWELPFPDISVEEKRLHCKSPIPKELPKIADAVGLVRLAFGGPGSTDGARSFLVQDWPKRSLFMIDIERDEAVLQATPCPELLKKNGVGEMPWHFPQLDEPELKFVAFGRATHKRFGTMYLFHGDYSKGAAQAKTFIVVDSNEDGYIDEKPMIVDETEWIEKDLGVVSSRLRD